MKSIDKTALLEGLKQILRMALITVLPLLISQLQSQAAIDWRVIGVTAAVAILSGIDKWLHLKDVETPLDLTFIK